MLCIQRQCVTCGLNIWNDREKKKKKLSWEFQFAFSRSADASSAHGAVDHPWVSALTGPAAVRCVSSTVNKAKDEPRLSEWSQRLKTKERKCLSPLSIWPVSPRPRRSNATEVTVTATDRTAAAAVQVEEHASYLHVSLLFSTPLHPLHLPLYSCNATPQPWSYPSRISTRIDSCYWSPLQKRLEISSYVKVRFHSQVWCWSLGIW